jgi:hypothetical protein
MITEETLLLYFYDELEPADRVTVEAALRNDAGLASRYARLSAELAGWRSTQGPAAVPAAVTARWRVSIDHAASVAVTPARTRTPMPRLRLFGSGVALAAALAIGIAVGVRLDRPVASDPTAPTPIAGNEGTVVRAVPASFIRGLEAYLQESQWEIARLPLANNENDERTALIMQLIQQNRAFERIAEQSNAPNLARVLRAFEPILFKLANENIAPTDAQSLRDQLAFELKATLTKLEQATSEEVPTI